MIEKVAYLPTILYCTLERNSENPYPQNTMTLTTTNSSRTSFEVWHTQEAGSAAGGRHKISLNLSSSIMLPAQQQASLA